jgi:hypothetical protein
MTIKEIQVISGSSKNSNKSIPIYMRKMLVRGLHPNLATKRLIEYFSQFDKFEKGII